MADRDAYGIVGEKSRGPNWQINRFTVEPDRRARFYDPTCRADPRLPVPAPRLYAYDLPLLATPDAEPRELESEPNEEVDSSSPADSPVPSPKLELPSQQTGDVEPAGHVVTLALPPRLTESPVIDASYRGTAIGGEFQEELPAPLTNDDDASLPQDPDALLSQFGQESVIRIPPIPQDAWESLPPSCLQRMLEFAEIREAYVRSFNTQVDESMLDSAPRVTLGNILELAMINNREFQSRREQLYATALSLSLERFDYDLRFLRRGNGTDVGYIHNRVGGVEVNTLGIGNGIGITKSLYTAGELVSRFANDVLLTFNGASGFSSNVSSAILVELTQPILQRDIRFEALTQAERDVVYAARDYVRFRKQLFRDLSVQYYNLLLSYRNIAINTQDYFSNLDGFNRAAATYEIGETPRFQVDQFEQNVLRSRGSLINVCNTLEGSLDRLKLNIGLPPEMPLNVDLSELEDLTLSDEATVIQEQIRRSRLFANQQLEQRDSGGAVAAAAELARRMLSFSQIQDELREDGSENGPSVPTNSETATLSDTEALEILAARLEAEDKRVDAAQAARVLRPEEQSDISLLPAQVYLRKEAVLELLLEAVQKELQLLRLLTVSSESDAERLKPLGQDDTEASFLLEWQRLVGRYEAIGVVLRETPDLEKSQQLPAIIGDLDQLLAETNNLQNRLLQRLSQFDVELFDTETRLQELCLEVIARSGQFQDATSGLTPLDVDMDEAMLTALVNRLDLMNQRGTLADAWRQIKYAGDNLRSILNVRASQSIRTRLGSNNPFDFTFDDSTTNLGIEFDAPLNRRIERNVFRLALINYNATLRNVMQAEDLIKLDIRDDLRALALDQNQYMISIASAALAYERVNSTRIQLAFGRGNITARDFLEAQQAYTTSLSDVARQHIGYIIDRIEFFLDLEQLQVDEVNYWPDLRNEAYPFIPSTDFAGVNPFPYGQLSCGPRYSDCILRQERVPAGIAHSLRPPEPRPFKFEPGEEESQNLED